MSEKTVEKIIKILSRKYYIDIRFGTPFRVLIGVVLSHRTNDRVSVPATNRLFKRANAPEKIIKLSEREIVKLIYPVGFYKQKAKRIKKICKILLEKYDGKVPKTREELMELPGVGGKSADIVLSYAYGQPVIAVDAHVLWVSNQLEWSKSNKPEKVREDLHRIIPLKYRLLVNQLLVEFGKDICITDRPKCQICAVEKYCPNSRLKRD